MGIEWVYIWKVFRVVIVYRGWVVDLSYYYDVYVKRCLVMRVVVKRKSKFECLFVMVVVVGWSVYGFL